MKTIKRREFIKKTTAGTATLAMGTILGYSKSGKKRDFTKVPYGEGVIDAHLHSRPETVARTIKVMDQNHIRYAINIGIRGDDAFYKMIEATKPYSNRLGTMYTFDWDLIQTEKDFFEKAPDRLERAVKAGAIGVKSFKQLGLMARDRDGSLLRIDDERLFPVWERAGELGIVVAFHTSDPLAFFQPWNPQNERWKEMELHPEWSFADREKYPERNVLLEMRNNVIRSFPNTQFHCCHVANNPENMESVAKLCEELPNFHLDIAARLGELGRHPAKVGRDFFNKFQDRIMFGTDRMFLTKQIEVQGAGPAKIFTKEEDNMFYETHWRYLQTMDKQFDHPTPIQGNWKIDGIGLDEKVCKKIYWDNAYKLFNLEKYGVA